MKHATTVIATSCLMVIMGASFLNLAYAPTVFADQCANEKTFLGIKPWYSGVCGEDGKVAIGRGSDDLTTDIWHIVLNVISIGILLAGYIAVALVIWGGVKYMLAGGESGKISAAKSTIQNALIGLLIALSAYAIVTFITGRLS